MYVQTKATRGLEHATTVSFEKRRQREDYEKLLEERMLMEEASRRDQLAKPKGYEEYAQPVMKTYDRIVARNLGILRGVHLDERARSLKEYFQQQKVSDSRHLGGDANICERDSTHDNFLCAYLLIFFSVLGCAGRAAEFKKRPVRGPKARV